MRTASPPSEAIQGKTSPHEDRRQQKPRNPEAQRCDIPCVKAGRNGQSRDDAPACPDRYCSKAEHCALQITPAGRLTDSIAHPRAVQIIPNEVPPTRLGTAELATKRNPVRS